MQPDITGSFARGITERALAAHSGCFKDAAPCDYRILRRFRKTFATMRHANGRPRVLQAGEICGESDH